MTPSTLSAGDPLSLTLAADARLCSPDYADDQIWELRLAGGEPPSLSVETTFGLRANRMRVFPRFIRAGVEASDPGSFQAQPSVLAIRPSYVCVTFQPFEGLEVTAEYWVPDSHTLAGRFTLANTSILVQVFQFEVAALLNPIDRQGGFAPIHLGGIHALGGETANLQPVVYVQGASVPPAGPYPSLALDLEIYPGSSRQVMWAAAALHEAQQSLDTARQSLTREWDAETARLELIDRSHMVQFETGVEDWDTALLLAQRAALQCFQQNPLCLPHPGIVMTRQPDQGFSALGDGRDYSGAWRGQSALDAWYAAHLLPGAPHLAAGVIRNFLTTQDSLGRVDSRPGLGGQRTGRRAQPILAAVAFSLSETLGDPAWAGEVYGGLVHFFENWLDTGDDSLPAWENPQQSGVEDSPIFNRFGEEARGLEPARLVSPGLIALLYQECRALITAAEARRAKEDLRFLHTAEAKLHHAISETWDPAGGIFRYRDRQTRQSLPSASVVTFQGSGTFISRRRFKQPRRLVIRIESADERTSAASITLFGYTARGEASESFSPGSFSWLNNQAHVTTSNTYVAFDRIEAQGLREHDQVRVFTPDYTLEDCSLFLPLAAGAPNPQRARQMVETALLTRFWMPHGIPTAPGASESISMVWNALVGEGLLRYGYRRQAADLLTRLMNTAVASLKEQRSFYQVYDAKTGQPGGERGHLQGIPPVGFFLHALGIQSISSRQILVDGFNPFPNAITVQYRKVLVRCHSDRTEVIFPAGQQVTIDKPGPHRITLSS